ncbi:MAG: murein hydrolase activator EnvC family protein [Rhizomicrobium sp.]
MNSPVVAAPGTSLDLSNALPGKALGQLPTSAQELGKLKREMAHGQPLLLDAKQKSEALAEAAGSLRRKLVATAARVEGLERETVSLGDQIAILEKKNKVLAQGFRRDRDSVTRLLAVLERLQYEMPPALAVRPDDVLAAARGSMLVGASLPPLYAKAAQLGRRVDALEAARRALLKRRADAAKVAADLSQAREDLAVLANRKEAQAEQASGDYAALKSRLAAIAGRAADFEALVARVAALRRRAGGAKENGIVTVAAGKPGSERPLAKDSLLPPAVGTIALRPQDNGATVPENDGNPGLTYVTQPGAQVIAPADGRVLFAGPYHGSGQVLILEITTGYDLVLAGLGRVSVRPNDELLAGEPVGNMPAGNGLAVERLYFELRRNGRGMDPRPWLSLELRKAKGT